MAQRRHHYETAFEHFLRSRRLPYISVNEAKRALLPKNITLKVPIGDSAEPQSLKSFDFIVYTEPNNLLLDIKGRKVPRTKTGAPAPRSSFQNWVTQDDIHALQIWRSLFGTGFEAAFLFVYWCDDAPPDGLFQEIFEHHDRWYALRAVSLSNYMAQMRTRSVRWNTVHIPSAVFERISQPFSDAIPASQAGPSTP